MKPTAAPTYLANTRAGRAVPGASPRPPSPTATSRPQGRPVDVAPPSAPPPSPDALRPTWRLTLTPTGPGPEGIQRIRHALKILLRTCGLRCTDIEGGATPTPALPAAPETEGAPCRGK
ncbi:MAG TPA: hypothetical protein VH253_17015 [Phycisphaerae bacterium]|nr:hypothetical protein [Phycisphaerae bacterium]